MERWPNPAQIDSQSGFQSKIASTFEKLLAFKSEVHDPVALPGIPAGEVLDFIAAAAMQHARRHGEGTIFAIDSGKGLAGGEAHLLQAGVGIEKRDLEPNPLEGLHKVLPTAGGEGKINGNVRRENGFLASEIVKYSGRDMSTWLSCRVWVHSVCSAGTAWHPILRYPFKTAPATRSVT